jgi:hypothetical protein
MAQNAGATGADYLHEWRANVDQQISEQAEDQQRTAIILERLTNRLDEHDRRIKALEDEPGRRRSEAITRRGLSLQEFYIALLVVGLLLSFLTPHLSWH